MEWAPIVVTFKVYSVTPPAYGKRWRGNSKTASLSIEQVFIDVSNL
jgi:hypothetical protein